MSKKAMRRNLTRSILRSKGRYIAISAIIALGAGLFIGLLMTKTDMIATGQKYITEKNMFDLRMVSNYGWTEDYVEKFAALDGIEAAEGVTYVDLIARENDKDEAVYRFYNLPENLNKLTLYGGRMPEKNNECLADGFRADDSILGTKIYISTTNDPDDLSNISYREFTVVGYVASPLYMDMNRGTTSIGSGSLQNYFFVPAKALSTEVVSEIHLTIPGDHAIYSKAYTDLIDDLVDRIEPAGEELNRQRFQEVKDEAEELYADGYEDYLEGLEEYEDGKQEAEEELADAEQELKDAEEDIREGEEELAEAREDLISAENQVATGMKQLEQGWYQWNQGVAQFEAQLPAAQAAIAQAWGQLNAMAGYMTPEQYEAASQQIKAQEDQLEAAESTLKATERTLDETQRQVESAQDAIWRGWGEWRDGMEELEDGKQELEDGWEDYREAKAEVEKELADAEKELKDAEEELRDARKDIDELDEPDLMILDRESNVGYNNLDSSSDIVAGVSRVFPVFFLLIASLVCITTMTRMIDEERTQIGTLKALGYTSGEIISKYLIYSGSSALIGCGLGALLGSTIFPQIIWQAYSIMLFLQKDVVLTVDWPLIILVTASYLAVMLLVTWYCCYRTLKEEPAELIRPKAPEAGRQILLEKLPLWQKMSFLNKVAIRNIFRFRQRLAMMLIGIGGCTALLIAGFGLRDSIINVVDYQFEEVTLYDMSVYFREEPRSEERLEFEEAIAGKAEDFMFYHQSSVDIRFGNRTKELYMISAGPKLETFLDLHTGTAPLPLPGVNEAVLSVGVSDNMGIQVGDQILLRNADMQELTVTVSGIYENYIENYVIVSPETMEAQWGETPEMQMAFVTVPEGGDSYSVGAAITGLDTVMNVSVSEDLAEMVGGMMDALDLVIVVVVFCAGLLAIITLYNLTNININERIREIATIKVLGFNASETASYVFKENMVLTVAGSIFGLGLGRLLLEFIMRQIKIDMVWFQSMLTPLSCVLSVVLTLASAVAVVFIFYFKLDKINMAEALKSVE